MARSGSFGRLPRAAPDLSATIAAMMREYQAQVDQNYVDAWKNGGKVDGEPVTDDRLLAHFKGRRDALSKDDPLWTEWDNRVTQYEFAIEDSKMQVEYDNGRASDAQMSAFYARWAAKTPDNTEFDRQLLSAVGKYRAAAAARGRAASGRAGSNKYLSDMNNFVNRMQPAVDTSGALLQFFVSIGIAPYNATDLSDVPASMAGEAMDILKDGVRTGTTGDPIYDAAITRLTTTLKDAIPGFDWSKDGMAQIASTLEAGSKAADQAAAYIAGSPHASKDDIEKYAKWKKDISFAATNVNSLGYEAILKENRDAWQKEMELAHGDPFAERAATEKYLAAQRKTAGQIIEHQVGDRPDPVLTGIENEQRQLTAALNGQEVADPQPDWFDSPTVGGNGSQSAVSTYKTVFATGQGLKLLSDGGWVQIMVDPANTTKASYVVMPKDAPRQTGMILIPGQTITDPATGMSFPVYDVPARLQVAIFDQNGTQLNIPKTVTDQRGVEAKDAKGNPIVDPTQDSGVDFIKGVDSNGNLFLKYRVVSPVDGSVTWLLSPPVRSGVKAEVTWNNGVPTLQYTVDTTMVNADGTPIKPKAAGPSGYVAPAPGTSGTTGARRKELADKYKQTFGFDLHDPIYSSNPNDPNYYRKPDVFTEGQRIPAPGGIGWHTVTAAEAALSQQIATEFAGVPTDAAAQRADALRKVGIDPSNPDRVLTAEEARRVAEAMGLNRKSPVDVGLDEQHNRIRLGTSDFDNAVAAMTGKTLGGWVMSGTGGTPGAPAQPTVMTAPASWQGTNLIDATLTSRDPVTGLLHSGAYQSDHAVDIQRELEIIDASKADAGTRIQKVKDSISSYTTELTAKWQEAVRTGRMDDASRLQKELGLWQADLPTLSAAVTERTGGAMAGTLLTSAANVVTSFFAQFAPQDQRRNADGSLQTPERTMAVARALATDQYGATAYETGRGFADRGATARTPDMASNRALKLPDITAALPFLKPLADFVGSAQVPQLGSPNTTPPPLTRIPINPEALKTIKPPTTVSAPTWDTNPAPISSPAPIAEPALTAPTLNAPTLTPTPSPTGGAGAIRNPTQRGVQ